MHLEPEITRCRILIGICAASFGLGDHPSYASEPVSIQHFNCWEAFGNKTLQNATDTRLILPSWRERPDASFSLAPRLPDHDRNLFLIELNIPEISRGLGEPNPLELVLR